MRWLLIPLAIGVLVGGAAAALIIVLRGSAGAKRQRIRTRLDSVLGVRGSARCFAALGLLRELERSSSENQVSTWDLLELPLLEALPDCPPDMKIEMVNCLDALARACSHRETSRRVTTLRNSMLA